MKKKKQNKSDEAVKTWQKQSETSTDALGSYTGIPSDGDNKPEQDADDL